MVYFIFLSQTINFIFFIIFFFIISLLIKYFYILNCFLFYFLKNIFCGSFAILYFLFSCCYFLFVDPLGFLCFVCYFLFLPRFFAKSFPQLVLKRYGFMGFCGFFLHSFLVIFTPHFWDVVPTCLLSLIIIWCFDMRFLKF